MFKLNDLKRASTRRVRGVSLALVLLLLFPGLPRAETDSGSSTKAILIAVQAFAYLTSPPRGEVGMAVVYDPNNPLSLANLKTVMDLLARNAEIDDAVIRPVSVPVTDLERLKDFHFVLLGNGLQNWFSAVAAIAHDRGTLTLSTDPGCVRSGQCVMGVVAENRVQVLISRVAAQAAGVDFAVSFRLMITEL